MLLSCTGGYTDLRELIRVTILTTMTHNIQYAIYFTEGNKLKAE